MDLLPEGVAEGDFGERRATARIMDDISNDSLQVAISLAKVETAKACRPFAVVSVGLEDGSRSLTLSSDHTPHLSLSLSLSLYIYIYIYLFSRAALRGRISWLRLGFYCEILRTYIQAC
jgi:hypothetical protein